MRRINEAGQLIVTSLETLYLEAYLCPARVWTIGYGHTGPDVRQGLTIDEATAYVLLSEDIIRFEEAVDRYVFAPLSSNQFSALVSLAFNIGENHFRTSTLVRLLNEGMDYEGAARQFRVWRKARGVVLPGLVRRRALEEMLFRTPDTEPVVCPERVLTGAQGWEEDVPWLSR